MSEQTDRLTRGLDPEQRANLGDLGRLGTLMEAYTSHEPGPAENATLLARLDAYLASPSTSAPVPDNLKAQPGIQHWLRLAKSQLSLLERSFIWACGFVLLLGLLLSALGGESFLVLALVFLSPALAAVGVGYAFRPATQTLWELEKITPTHPLELLYIRMALVLGFNFLIALVLFSLVWLGTSQIVFWRLLIAWLGPMLALSGVALYTAVHWSTLAGILVPLGIWGSLVSMGWWQAIENAPGSQMAGAWLVQQISQSTPLLVSYLLALFFGGLLLWQSVRAVGGQVYHWN